MKFDYETVKSLLTDTREEFLERFDPSLMLISVLVRKRVIDAAAIDRLNVPILTKHEKINVLLDCIEAKGVPAFLDFCLTLCQENVAQGHLVTEVMGIDINDVRRQRDGIATDSSDISAKEEPAKGDNVKKGDSHKSPTNKQTGNDTGSAPAPAASDHPPSTEGSCQSTTKHQYKPDQEEAIIDKAPKHVTEEEAISKLDFERNYKMTSKPRGKAIILNVENYYRPGMDREGSSADVINLAILFHRLHFKVDLWINYTSEQIRDRIRAEQSSDYHTECDAFIMVVMGHGTEGKYKAADLSSLSIMDDLVKPFNGNRAKGLVDKPKLFFIQTCRVDVFSGPPPRHHAVLSLDANPEGPDSVVEEQVPDSVVEEQVPESIEMADILVVHSTSEGFPTFRNTELGCYFIRDLVTVFTERCHEDHLLDMITEVTRKVKDRPLGSEGQYRQLCTMSGQLTRRLYFLPGYFKDPEPKEEPSGLLIPLITNVPGVCRLNENILEPEELRPAPSGVYAAQYADGTT